MNEDHSSDDVLLIQPPGLDGDFAEMVNAVTGATCMTSMEMSFLEARKDRPTKYAVIYPNLRIARTNASPGLLERTFGIEQVASNFELALLPFRRADDDELKEFELRSEAAGDAETWGFKAVRGQDQQLDGSEVRVCVVDTGIELDHPDFAHQGLTPNSGRLHPLTLSGQIDDKLGHGSHCAGLVCGPAKSFRGPRYGIAPRVELFVAQVFGNTVSTTVEKMIAALDWAVGKACHIVSMSLYKPANPADDPQAKKFQIAVDRALARGTLLVACTGNNSDRRVGKVISARFPANLKGVLAVGGIDEAGNVVNDSNSGGLVVAPGDIVWSAHHDNALYALYTGTSTATAYAAGVAALHAQKFPHPRGRDLLQQVLQSAEPLNLPPADVGRGLIKAP